MSDVRPCNSLISASDNTTSSPLKSNSYKQTFKELILPSEF